MFTCWLLISFAFYLILYIIIIKTFQQFQVAHGVAGWYMYLETRDAIERRDRNMALVMQMYPTPGLEGSLSQWTAHGSQFI